MSLFDLKGKVALVTGGNGGIGLGMARGFASAGADVIIAGRKADKSKAAAAELAKLGVRTGVIEVDVADEASCKAMVAAAVAQMGRLDILVNNAGLNIPDRSWARLSPEGIDKIIHGNLSSAFYVVQAVLPLMRRQGGGLFIHTASWAGRFVGPVPGPAYIAAKHGMVAMSHSLNLEECGHGIRSTVLCPGEVATPIMTERPIPETTESLARMVQPEDMGELIAFVAQQPPHVVINEVVVSPTYNRGYISQMKARQAQAEAAGMKT